MSKYLMVLTDLGMGGITVAATNLCNELSNAGHKVDVLLMNDETLDSQIDFCPNINFLRLTGKNRLWNLNKNTIKVEKNILKKGLFLALGVVKKIVNQKSKWIHLIFGNQIMFSGYDVAIAYRQCSSCYYLVLNCVEAKKKVGFVHGDLNYMDDISTWKLYMNDFDVMAYVSEGVRKGFVERYPELEENSCVIYNMFDSAKLLKKAKENTNILWTENAIRIVTVSRIENATKAIFRIPQICKLLKKKYGEIFYWNVVGDGPEYNECIQKVKEMKLEDCLGFVGAKRNPYPYISQADFTVLPSYTEAFPMTVCESLILGVPVIVAEYPAVNEQIRNFENGIIAEQSIESIAEKIGMLLECPHMLKNLKMNTEKYSYCNDIPMTQLMKVTV